MTKELFDSIDGFETDSNLFINFAFFTLLDFLGTPFITKIEQDKYLYQTSKEFFESLYIKCRYVKEKDGSYLDFNTEEISNIPNKKINTFIYSKLKIGNKEITLKGNYDKFDEKTSRIKLSEDTLEKINKQCPSLNEKSLYELYFSDHGLKTRPQLKNLVNLFTYYNNINKNDSKSYKQKMNMFKEKLQKPLQANENNDKTFFEIEKNGNNRIKYENLQLGEIYFIQGPPGTGKTYVIQKLIEELSEKNELNVNGKYNKIIISSQVHQAINNVIENLLGKEGIPKDTYNKFYDFYQYMTILYSNRALSNLENSNSSKLIELDTLLDKKEHKEAQDIYQTRKEKTKLIIDDFEGKLQSLIVDKFDFDFFTNKKTIIEKLGEGHKFKTIFNLLNNSNQKFVDYEKTFALVHELSHKHYKNFIKTKEIDWGVHNYSDAIKRYSNVIFCTLENLPGEIDRQNDKSRLLVIIDEASQSNIINYLLLLNKLENITLLILGDPRQLNNQLAFNNDITNSERNGYADILSAFTYKISNNKTDPFENLNRPNDVIEKLMEILFEIKKDNQIYNTNSWEKILKETFFEKLFESAISERKELLKLHRRSRREIFELTKFLYTPNGNYELLERKHDDNLQIPNFNTLTRIVIDYPEYKIDTISKIIKKWQKQKEIYTKKQEQNQPNMSMAILTYYNDYIKEFKTIKETNNNDISVFTIDKSQGEEYTTVVLYLDTNSKGTLTEKTNTMDYHRLNVAVSRAREQLIIVETKRFVKAYKELSKKLSKNDNFKNIITLINNIHEIPERGDSNE